MLIGLKKAEKLGKSGILSREKEVYMFAKVKELSIRDILESEFWDKFLEGLSLVPCFILALFILFCKVIKGVFIFIVFMTVFLASLTYIDVHKKNFVRVTSKGFDVMDKMLASKQKPLKTYNIPNLTIPPR